MGVVESAAEVEGVIGLARGDPAGGDQRPADDVPARLQPAREGGRVALIEVVFPAGAGPLDPVVVVGRVEEEHLVSRGERGREERHGRIGADQAAGQLVGQQRTQAIERVITEGRRLHDAGVPVAEAAAKAQFGTFTALPRYAENVGGALGRVYLELDGQLPRR